MKPHFLKQVILVNTLMIISVLTIFTFSSCNKKEMDNNETVLNDNYYVKYIISSSYPRIFSNWSVTTPDGKYTKNDYQTRHWEQTYGPVKKGFKCEVQVENGEPTIEIYVSKNQESFALKTTKIGMSASYTIDF
jgi:hypothetical protein